MITTRGALIRAAAIAVLALAVWWVLAPTQLGGRNAYVTTHGISMEPRFHTGDLGVLRVSDAYRVGDVAAYRSTVLRTVVMHRIVAVQDGLYTFKGDNNSWLDPEQVPRQALLGTLVLRVPHGGTWLSAARSPAALALIAFLLVSATGGAAYARRRRHGRRRTMSRHAAAVLRPSRGDRVPAARVLRVTVVALAVLAAVGTLVAWTVPLGTSRTSAASAAPTMTFSYRAQVRPSPAYDTTSVTSPDPVFRKVAKSVSVRYEYRGDPGTIGLTAELSTSSGWHSSVPLVRPVAVHGHRHSGRARLDLAAFQRRADAGATATGLPASTVAVAVRASVRTRRGGFAPTLKLVLTPLQLALAGDPAGLVVTGTAVPGTTTVVPNSLPLAGWAVPVGVARAISVAALLAALGAVVLALRLTRGAPEEGTAIRRRYGPLLVPVRPATALTGAPVVDVDAFATLAKLAERYGLLVLHWSEGGVETFVVQDESAVYRYSTAGAAAVWPVPTSGRRRAIPAAGRTAARTADLATSRR